MSSTREPTALERLIAEPKGQLAYAAREAFLLHVCWEAPTPAVARELLAALRLCAAATHRDTPCVPTYFFRVSHANAHLLPPVPRTLAQHPQLNTALLKLQRGVPPPAVHADLRRRGLDPALLLLDETAELPREYQVGPVAVEFTELYLDERAFMQHAGSRDYLAAYGTVTAPGMANGTPVTVRMGTPPASMVERILDPFLRAQPCPLHPGESVFAGCSAAPSPSASFLSLDLGHPPASTAAFVESCAATTCVSFPHPLIGGGVTRLLVVLPALPHGPDTLAEILRGLDVIRGDIHMPKGTAADLGALKAVLDATQLSAVVLVNAGECAGYVLHERSAEVKEATEPTQCS